MPGAAPLHPLPCARLVGVAEVPKVDDLFCDTFLMLPTNALAVMSCELEFF